MRNLPGDDDDPEKDPGAFHSAELWYMFHTLKNSWRPFTEADYALSNKMVDYWTSFCKTGDPGNGWEAYKRDAPFKKEFDVE
ncbi:MAG: carboxylesterase family protein [Candidatus Cryptobacteroides sp.]